MAKPTQASLAAVIDDELSYILAYAPDFPTEDSTTTEEEFDRVLRQVQELWMGVQDVQRRRTLDLVGRELVEARSCFLGLECELGRSLVVSAQEHLKEWRERKKVKATFIVGPDGDAEKVK